MSQQSMIVYHRGLATGVYDRAMVVPSVAAGPSTSFASHASQFPDSLATMSPAPCSGPPKELTPEKLPTPVAKARRTLQDLGTTIINVEAVNRLPQAERAALEQNIIRISE